MKYVVRAMPPRGAERRFRAGRAWGKEPTVVEVVDNPEPPQKERDRDGRLVVVPSNQISVKDLAALQADGHFAVSPFGESGFDADDVAALKLRAIKLEEQLLDARRELAGYAEQMRAVRSVSSNEAAEAGAAVARLQHELGDVRAQLGAALSRAKDAEEKAAELERRAASKARDTEPVTEPPAKKGDKK